MDAEKRPLEDEFDRETFYRGPDPDVEDEDEYELMPPDEELAEAERRRAREEVERAQISVDMQQLERDERGFGELDAEEYLQRLKELKFQFGTRHLLIATAVVAVGLAIGMAVGGIPFFLVGTFALLAGAYGYITWQESKAREELEARRMEIYERKRRQEGPPTPPHQ